VAAHDLSMPLGEYTDMKHSDEPKRKYDIFSLLGWILGDLSLLNLIEDLTPLKLLR